MMSDWNELFGVEEKTIVQKKLSTPVKSSIDKRPQATHTSVMPEGSRITKDDLENLQNNILKAMNHMIPEGLEQHLFSRENLLWCIGTKGERGTKLYELRDFFYPTDAQTIKEMIDTLFFEGLLKKNRHGWMSLTNKSPELYNVL